MNLNKLERRIKELDKFFPLLDSKEEVEMIRWLLVLKYILNKDFEV